MKKQSQNLQNKNFNLAVKKLHSFSFTQFEKLEIKKILAISNVLWKLRPIFQDCTGMNELYSVGNKAGKIIDLVLLRELTNAFLFFLRELFQLLESFDTE